MKIKSLLFIFALVALVAVISYYIGGSMRGTNPDQQSIHTPIVETEHSVPSKRDTVEAKEAELEHQKQGPKDHYANEIQEPEHSALFPKDIMSKRQLSSRELRSVEAPTGLAASGLTPQDHIDKQLEGLKDYYKDRLENLKTQRPSKEQWNSAIASMQSDYDAQKYAIMQVKQQLDTIQEMINKGAITPEAGNEAMWRLVLPERTHEALFPKSNQSKIEQ